MIDVKERIADFIVRGIEGDLSDRHGFDLILDSLDDDIRVELLDAWRRLVIAAFDNARPTPRDIDDIVKSQNLVPSETHAVERTVAALWGKR